MSITQVSDKITVYGWALFKIVAFGALLIAVLLAVQFAMFHRILAAAPVPPAQADAIVVFMGADRRVPKGYELAAAGLAPYLILSPAGLAGIKRFDRQYGAADQPFRHLVEDRAATTFQNALLTGRLIRGAGMESCLLVTDLYHMPRSLLLLKLTLAGQAVAITPAPVDPGDFARSPLRWTSRQKKVVYNEMIKFWGSLGEMAHYRASGTLPEPSLDEGEIVAFLRAILLFDLD